MNTEKAATLVTGTIGNDIHSLGIKVIEHALSSVGFKVVPLGIQTPQEDIIKAAVETDADAILISSLSGHARMLCQGLREKCIEAGAGGGDHGGPATKKIELPANWDELVKKYDDIVPNYGSY